MDVFKTPETIWHVNIAVDTWNDAEGSKRKNYRLTPYGVSNLKLAVTLANDKLSFQIGGKDLTKFGSTGRRLCFRRTDDDTSVTVLFDCNKPINLTT